MANVAHEAVRVPDVLSNFYEEELLPKADSVYRFAIALTLSLDGATVCVNRTFEEATKDLEAIHKLGAGRVTVALMSRCWHIFQSLQGVSFKSGEATIIKIMRPLEVLERAAVTMVDVCELPPSEAETDP